ncbi:MAG: hypothetical protein KGJ88_09740 [Verrucomicrobiota bacterium]|nr:hypothetical protein [Verrucomicrobiota bacterium]
MIFEACRALKRNRDQYLARRSTAAVIKTLSEVAAHWRRPDNAFRKLALHEGPEKCGFSKPTLAKGLDDFFCQLTPENFQSLLKQDIGDAADPAASTRPCRRFWRGPEFLVHITTGNPPNPAWMSIILGLLARSAQFVKCAAGASFLPRLFAHSIYDADPKLGACLEIADWPGGNAPLENVLFAEADCVTATGADETLAAIRNQIPIHTRFLGYGHRVSFAFVARDALSQAVSAAADDVAAWNQLGCLSPHVIYVEEGAGLAPEKFAEHLAAQLEQREADRPRGRVSPAESAAIASRRAIYDVRAAHSPETTRHWCSKNSTAWTVVFEADPRFQLSCLNRFIYVKAVPNLNAALQAADGVRGRVSTVGLAAPEDKMPELAAHLARWGVTRVCPLGQMQNPPLTWRHDGQPAFGALISWTDFES